MNINIFLANGVFSFFNNMVTSIDTLLTPKTVDRTGRTGRQIYETPSKSNLITMTPRYPLFLLMSFKSTLLLLKEK